MYSTEMRTKTGPELAEGTLQSWLSEMHGTLNLMKLIKTEELDIGLGTELFFFLLLKQYST